MKFFLDTGDVEELRSAVALGVVDGVTTNPSLIAKSGRRYRDVVTEVCDLVDGPVSAEVLTTSWAEMMEEARMWRGVHDNVVVKLPLTPDGLRAVRDCTREGIPTNVTLCFSANQALLAAKAGASYISPFIGRLDDVGETGLDLIKKIITIYDNYQLETEVLVASVRSPAHVTEAALLGADVCTIPWSVMKLLIKHPLTDAGLKQFVDDAAKIPL